MGFLDKHNPRATPESARVWAIGGGIASGLAGAGLGLMSILNSGMPAIALLFIIPVMAGVGAVAGWAMEWQLNDGPDDDASAGRTE